METLKTFFVGQFKPSDLPNDQQSGLSNNNNNSRSSATMESNPGRDIIRNPDTKLTNKFDAKSVDSDNYFYIMWRS